MAEKKPFKYYAIRVANGVIFRRTVGTIEMVKSIITKRNSDLLLQQVSYRGGKVIGYMPYTEWVSYTGTAINLDGYKKLTRERYKALLPFIRVCE